MTIDELVSFFEGATSAEKRAWLTRTVPKTHGSGMPPDIIAGMLDWGTIEGDLTALDAIVLGLVHGGQSTAAAQLASVARQLLFRALDSGSNLTPTLLMVGRRIFSNFARALQHSGHPETARAQLVEALERLPFTGEARADLEGSIAESLLDEQKYPECREFIDQHPYLANFDLPVLQNVRERLQKTGNGFELPKSEDAAERARQALRQVGDTLSQLVGGNEPALAEALRQRFGSAAPEQFSNDKAFDALARSLGVHDDGASPLADEQTMRVRAMHAGRELRRGVDGGDQATFTTALALASSIVEFARAHDFPEDECNALWMMGVSLRRLDQPHEAARTLDELHERAWTLRRKLRDPVQGIDFTSRFPHLFAVRCELAAKLRSPSSLFGAIEASKGQIIADTLDAASVGEGAALPGERDLNVTFATTKEHGFHYLTYFADDEVVRAALVTSRGQLHVAEITLERAVIERYSRKVDPSKWGGKLSLWARAPSDLPVALAALVSWLEPLLERGELRQDEHIVYCPDGALWLIPLQMLNLCGRPLLETFSLSRTHSIRSLLNQLRRPTHRPTQARAFEVTARDEPPAKQRAFELPGDYLEQQLAVAKRLRGPRGTIAAWCESTLTDAVVHLATHGIFPEDGMRDLDPNPLQSSGLLLADTGGLPVRSVHCSSVLTPTLVLSARQASHVTDSHVTLQACVSGWSRAGSGRDALGLEWAFGVRGASSVLSANWHVDVDTAATFCVTFYREWLEHGRSRAAAARCAGLELKKTSAAYEWAAFTLSGDFR